MLASRPPHSRPSRAAVRRRAPLAAALAILAGLSCFGDPSGPGLQPTARFSFAPLFSTSAAMVVDFDRVRISFTRPGTDGVVFDTVVSFPSNADTIALTLAVPVSGVGLTEDLTFNLALINAAGDTVFRGGPNRVTVTAGTTTAPVPVPIRYVGTGANAASVRITPRDTSVFFSDSVALTAIAFDSASRPIPGTPVEWTSLDTSRAVVPVPSTGRVRGRSQRGPARIRARLVTGQADTSLVRVQPVPSALALLAGNGQTGTVGATLAQPLAVRVTAVDGLGVVGVRVRFTVVSGGGTVDTLVVTDTAGYAAAQLRLGTASGPDTVRAAVTGLTGSPVTFVTTAQPGAARTLAVTVQPGTTPAGSFMTPALQVAARDTFGNVATAFTGTVTLAIANNPSGGTLTGSTSAAAVGGVATFANVLLDRPGAGYVLSASAPGLVAATTAAFTVVPGVPARLAFAVQPSTVTAGAAIAPAPQVQVQDALGNLVPSFTDTVAIALAVNPGGSTLSGTLRVAAVGGVATFAGLRLNRSGAGYRLVPSYASLARDSSAFFTVNVGPAAQLAFTVQPTASTAGVAITPAPQVTVRDSVGNTVTSFTDTVTVTIAANPGGGTLSGTTRVAAAGGVATFAALAIDRAATGYTLAAAATGLTAATSAAFGIQPAAATHLMVTSQPGTTTAGASITPAPQFAAADAFGNVVPSFAGVVSVAIGTNPGGATLSGTLAVNAVAGVATFSDLALNRTGAGYTLTATAAGLTAAATAAFAITPAAAATVVFTTQPSLVAAGTAMSPAVIVAIRDALGNVVTGYTDSVVIALAANPGGATLAGTLRVAAASGVATFANLSLNRAAPGYTLSATSAALTPATSTAFAVTPAAAAALAFTAQPTTTMASHTVPMSPPIVVTVRDQHGNTVTSYSDSVFLTATPYDFVLGTRRLRAVAGVATFADLRLDRAQTGYQVQATSGALTPATSTTFAVTAGIPMAIALSSGNGQVGAVSTALAAPLVAAVQDSFGNAVPGVSVTWAVTSGGGSLPATSLTDVAGLAQATWTLGALLGPQTASASVAGLSGSPVAFTASGSPSGSTSTWNGSASTDWGTGGNWSGGTAPTPTDIVFVPAAAGRQPRISTSTMVGGLIVQNGATLTIDTLQALSVLGNADASYASVGGPGWMFLAGTGTVRGHFRTLFVQGSYAIRDSLLVTDTLLVVGAGANLAGGGGYARIGRGLFVMGDGTLTMAAGDSIDVLGGATFAGGSENGRLTGGTLRVAGDFFQVAATSNQSFVATSNHRLVLNGTALQTVTMLTSGAGASSIGSLVVATTGGAGVVLASNVQVNGNLSVPTAVSITQATPYSLTVQGNLTTAGLLDLAALSVAGVLNAAPGGYVVQRTIFAGSGQTIPDTLPYRYLGLATGASAAFTAGMARTVDTVVTRGQLDVNGASITTGHLETAGGTGTLVMDAAGDAITVSERALFQGGSTTGLLTDGVLRVGGLYVGPTGAADAFAPSGNHQTEVLPPEVPTLGVDFAPGYDSTSHFHIFRVIGSRVTISGTARATGRTVLDAYVWLDGERFIALDTVEFGNYASRLIPSVVELRRGVASNPGGYDLAPTDTLILRGTDGVPDTISAGGANWTIPNLVVAGTDSVIDQTSHTIGGSLLVRGGVYLVDGSTTVLDSLVVTGTGVVAMSNGDASLHVNRDARFAGAPTGTHLSSGNLYFSGNFRQEGDPQSFRPTGVNVFTNRTPPQPQVFSFANPGAAASGFRDLYAGSEVRFGSDVYVGGTMVVYSGYAVNDTTGSRTATLAGGLTDYNTSVAGWRVDNTILTAAAAAWPTNTTTNLFVRNSLTATNYTVNGNVTVESGGLLDPGAGGVTVDGSLATTGTGVVRQTGGYIQVGQDASFAGTTDLTGGYLQIGGDFQQLGTTSFQASAGHTTVFNNPTVTQTVSFAAPDTAFAGSGSHFGTMEMGATGGVVRLLTDAAVQGTFTSGDIGSATLTGTRTLYMRGISQFGSVVIDSTLLTLVDGGSAGLGYTTFQNQPATATQFRIRRSDPALTFLSLTFNATPTTGGNYVAVQNLSGAAQTVDFQSATPASPGLFVQRTGSPLPLVLWNGAPVASTIRWANPAGGAWSVGANWVGGGAPLAGDIAVVDTPGTYTVTLDQSATVGGVSASYGQLDLNGRSLAVTGSFALSNTATLRMANALDNLNVTGNASFGGGSSTLSAGLLRVDGNLTQSGSSTSFAASGTHHTRLGGAGVRTISFANPSGTESHFNRLRIRTTSATADTVRVASSVVVLDSMVVDSASIVGKNAPYRWQVRGPSVIRGWPGATSFLPFVWEAVGPITATLYNVQVDTTVLMRNAAYNFTAPIYNTGGTTKGHLRVDSGTVTILIAFGNVVNGNLIASGAGRVIPAGGTTTTVNDSLITIGGGTLQMDSLPNPTLTVFGSARFSGGNTTNLLNGGILSVSRDFTQSVGSTAFVATGKHRVILTQGGTGITQNIAFGNAGTSFFRRLEIPSTVTRNVVLQSDALVNDSMLVLGGAAPTDIIGAGTTQRLRVNGVLRVTQQTASPRVAPPVLELAATPSVDSIFAAGRGVNPDTTVFLPGITSFPDGTPMRYKHVRIANNAVMTYNTGGFADSLLGDLVIDGSSTFAQTFGTLVVFGKLRTVSSGVLRMQTAGTELTVRDSAIFSGGATNGQLTNGLLRLRGAFVQGGGNAAAFSASAAHQTEFTGNPTGAGVVQNVSMANPGTGAALSHFNQMRLTRASLGSALNVKLNLLTNVQAALVVDTSAGQNDSILGTGTVTLTTDSMQLQNTVFNNAPLVLSSNNAFISANTLRFENMNSTVTYFTVNRNGVGASAITGMNFATVPTGAGRYFAVHQNAVGVAYTLTFNGTLNPATGPGISGLYTRTSAGTLPTVVWAGVTNP